MRISNALLAFSFLATYSLAGQYWDVDPGGTTMKFLSTSVSPRSAAIAGAGIAMPAGISEVSRNPLATTAVIQSAIGINEVIYSEAVGANLTSLYYGLPLQNINVSAMAFWICSFSSLSHKSRLIKFCAFFEASA
jgi:hypothetical protein